MIIFYTWGTKDKGSNSILKVSKYFTEVFMNES